MQQLHAALQHPLYSGMEQPAGFDRGMEQPAGMSLSQSFMAAAPPPPAPVPPPQQQQVQPQQFLMQPPPAPSMPQDYHHHHQQQHSMLPPPPPGQPPQYMPPPPQPPQPSMPPPAHPLQYSMPPAPQQQQLPPPQQFPPMPDPAFQQGGAPPAGWPSLAVPYGTMPAEQQASMWHPYEQHQQHAFYGQPQLQQQYMMPAPPYGAPPDLSAYDYQPQHAGLAHPYAMMAPAPGLSAHHPMPQVLYGADAAAVLGLPTNYDAQGMGAGQPVQKKAIPDWLQQELLKRKLSAAQGGGGSAHAQEESEQEQEEGRGWAAAQRAGGSRWGDTIAAAAAREGCASDGEEDPAAAVAAEAAWKAQLTAEVKKQLTSVLLEVTDEIIGAVNGPDGGDVQHALGAGAGASHVPGSGRGELELNLAMVEHLGYFYSRLLLRFWLACCPTQRSRRHERWAGRPLAVS